MGRYVMNETERKRLSMEIANSILDKGFLRTSIKTAIGHSFDDDGDSFSLSVCEDMSGNSRYIEAQQLMFDCMRNHSLPIDFFYDVEASLEILLSQYNLGDFDVLVNSIRLMTETVETHLTIVKLDKEELERRSEMDATYKAFERASLIFDNTPFRQELENFMEDVHERFEKGLINALAITSTIDDYAVSSKFAYNKDVLSEKALKYLISERFGLYLGGEYDFKVKILKVDNDRVRAYIEVVRLNDVKPNAIGIVKSLYVENGVSDVDSNAIKTAIELVNGPLNSLFESIEMGSTYMSRTIIDPELYAKIAKCDKSKLEEELESFADMMFLDSSMAKFGVFISCDTMEVRVRCNILERLRE